MYVKIISVGGEGVLKKNPFLLVEGGGHIVSSPGTYSLYLFPQASNCQFPFQCAHHLRKVV